jgi:hypothetical protein
MFVAESLIDHFDWRGFRVSWLRVWPTVFSLYIRKRIFLFFVLNHKPGEEDERS